MKKTAAIICACFVLVTGCSKDSAIKDLNKQLTGKWELVRATGGWFGTIEYAPGNGNTISFTGNTVVQHGEYDSSSYTINATYNIYTGKPCEFAEETTLIYFKTSDNNEYNNEIALTNGELKIGSTACIADGSTNFYRKIE